MSADLFKTGFLVTDLEAALRDLERWLDVRFTPVQDSPLALQLASGREDVNLRFVYSTSGAPYLELIETQPAGYYAAPEGSHLHHVGRWVDDLPAASEALATHARSSSGGGRPCSASSSSQPTPPTSTARRAH